jgi:hypothetical protein
MHYVQATRDLSPEWSKFSLGSMALVKVVEEAIEHGCRVVDLGGSPVEYKLHLGGRLSGATVVTVVRPGFVRRLRLGCFEAAAWVLHTGYARLWRRRIVPGLRLRERAFWDCWIRSRLDLP